MKYTKKQLVKAYEEWTSENRLNPSSFISDEDCLKINVKEYSEMCINTLIGYINK